MSQGEDKSWTCDRLQCGNVDAIQERFETDPAYREARDSVGDTPLLSAVCFDHLPLVEWLLEHGANPNAEAGNGSPCLMTAVESESDNAVEIVDRLIRAGADPHTVGRNGWTALHMAGVRGNLQKAERLIRAGADPNTRASVDAEETPLMLAACQGHAEVVQLLIAHGGDAALRDTLHRETSLQLAKRAAEGPRPELLAYLAEKASRNDASVADAQAAPRGEANVPLGKKNLFVAHLEVEAEQAAKLRTRDFAAVFRALEQ